MTWGRIDDQLWCNAKVLSFSLQARSLWLFSLSFGNCEQSIPAGHLTHPQACMLAAAAGAKPKHIAELVDKGGWERCGDGFLVHDLAKYRKVDGTAAERMQRWRDRNKDGGVTPPVNLVTTVTSDATVTRNERAPVPGPGPLESELRSEQPPARVRGQDKRWVLADDEVDRLVLRFGAAFGGADAVREEIEFALERESHQPKRMQWTDPWLGIQHWFRDSRRNLDYEAREARGSRSGSEKRAAAAEVDPLAKYR